MVSLATDWKKMIKVQTNIDEDHNLLIDNKITDIESETVTIACREQHQPN